VTTAKTVLLALAGLALLVVIVVVSVRAVSARNERWAATWEGEREALGLKWALDEASRVQVNPTLALQIHGERSGRRVAVGMHERDYEGVVWMCRVELRLESAPAAEDERARPILKGLKKRSHAEASLDGRTLVVERKGRHGKEGELRAFVAEVEAAGAELEQLGR
jgi:hypothetical protein